MEKTFQLRYNVFCLEYGYIPHKLFPNGKERNKYDNIKSTRMFVALDVKKTDNVLGVIRAIRDPKNKIYNSQDLYDSKGKIIDTLPVEKHISLDDFREKKRNVEQVTSLAIGFGRGKKMAYGLFKCIYLDAMDHMIDDIFIHARPDLCWMFEAIGFKKIYQGRYKIATGSKIKENKDVPVTIMHLDMHKIDSEFIKYFHKSNNSFLFRQKEYSVY